MQASLHTTVRAQTMPPGSPDKPNIPPPERAPSIDPANPPRMEPPPEVAPNNPPAELPPTDPPPAPARVPPQAAPARGLNRAGPAARMPYQVLAVWKLRYT